MAKLLKLRRGNTSQHGSFTGAEGEVTVDTDKDTLVVHDGSQAGGRPLAREDMSNVSAASIATSKIAAGALPTNVTVASANIVDGTIVNADVNASAAIDGTKVSPNFGSQDIQTSGDLKIIGPLPNIQLTDSDHDSDYRITNANGSFLIYDITNSDARVSINPSGVVDIAGNLNAGAGLDVTGDITVTADTTVGGTLLANGRLSTNNDYNYFQSNSNSNASLTIKKSASGADSIDYLQCRDSSNALKFKIGGNGNIDIVNGIDVSGDITVTGTVDGVDLAGLNNTVSALGIAGGAIASATTATTQSASDNSTKVATTAYTDTAISNLVNSAPATLDTLGEIATALNNDAALNTTLTNSIATKLPTAGGTITGSLTVNNTVSDGKGDLRKIPLNFHNAGTYTLVASDAGKVVSEATSGANITVPANIFTGGDAVTIMNHNSGNTTITQGSGVTMYNSADGSTGNRTLAARGMATIFYREHNVAYIQGSGLS